MKNPPILFSWIGIKDNTVWALQKGNRKVGPLGIKKYSMTMGRLWHGMGACNKTYG